MAAREDFVALATAGRGLADLHLDYEQIEPWPLTLTVDGTELVWAQRSQIEPARLRVTKMRYAKVRVDGRGVDDKTSIVYNEHVTVFGIPEQAQHYLLDLIARVTTVSVRTQEIVEGLPPLTVRD